MPVLQLKIQGTPRTISSKAFIKALEQWNAVLQDIDTAISGIKSGSLNWIIEDLSIGSLSVTSYAQSIIPGEDNAYQVIHNTMNGLNILEETGATPPYLSVNGIRHAGNLLALIGKYGITGYQLSDTQKIVNLTAKASVNIQQLLPERFVSYGSIEGRMEAINIHLKDNRFIVYHNISRKAVTCSFQSDQLEEIKILLGKSVIVTGETFHNVRNEPVRIQVERIRLLSDPTTLPTITQMFGSMPSLPDGQTSDEFIRSIRNE